MANKASAAAEAGIGADVVVSKPGYLEDYLTGEPVLDRPEERVRQVHLRRLVEEYGYPKRHMRTEFEIRKGSKLIGPADIAIFHSDVHEQSNLYIVVENKRQDSKDGVDQLTSYMSPTKAPFGVWFNGTSTKCFSSHTEAPYFRRIPDIPKYGQTLAEVGRYKKSDLEPATELRSIFESVHNYIFANQGLLKDATFKEILKLLFLKLADEKSAKAECDFSITDDELTNLIEGKNTSFIARIAKLFSRVKNEYRDVFDSSEEIRLNDDCLAYAVSALQKISLTRTEADIKGVAFQTFVGAYQRGDRGEFFTPAPILQMCIKMLNPRDDEFIIDPACGSGGFLVEALRHVMSRITTARPDMTEGERRDAGLRYARTYLRGIDFNPDLAKVAKMYMVLYDDGHTGIVNADSLLPSSRLNTQALSSGAGEIRDGLFDVVVTNPPFGTKGKITSKEKLSEYLLGRNWTKQGDRFVPSSKLRPGGQTPEILFIERCVQLLHPGGRLALVLPDGILTNTSLRYVRDYIVDHLQIFAVVSLPDGTFRQSGVNPKTSVIFGIKKEKQDDSNEDRVFMAELDRIGYDLIKKTAPLLFLRGEEGDVLRDGSGRPMIDTEIPQLLKEFERFKVSEGLPF
ncbi:N-6 DNA methylase [Streptomyces sp. NPDC018610]|uniref:N-6 DNA methylase n=1 Tax=Streptomyces sp. NPDC018610 TaxID=3365049 RepID=UPI00379FEC5B